MAKPKARRGRERDPEANPPAGLFEYKGYLGMPHVEDDVIAGMVLGIQDVITFEGDTVPEARKAFQDSIDDYLAWCERDGVDPEAPFSGELNFRVPEWVHREFAIIAERRRMPLGDYLARLLGQTIAGLRLALSGGDLVAEDEAGPGGRGRGTAAG